METIWYILEVLRVGYPVILIMGMIAIPILWISHNESLEEWEKLDKYYSSADDKQEKYDSDDNSIDPIDGHKPDLDK